MSEADLSFVSGTIKNVKTVPNPLMAAKIQKVCPIPITLPIGLKVMMVMNPKVQFRAPVMGPKRLTLDFG